MCAAAVAVHDLMECNTDPLPLLLPLMHMGIGFETLPYSPIPTTVQYAHAHHFPRARREGRLFGDHLQTSNVALGSVGDKNLGRGGQAVVEGLLDGLAEGWDALLGAVPAEQTQKQKQQQQRGA